MNPFVFLIDIIFQLYATALLIRLLLQWVRADFYNPVSQFIVKMTNPPVMPLRKIIPGYGGIDMATLLLAITVMAVKIIIIYQVPDPFFISMMTLSQTLVLIVSIFLYSIIIQAILSWVNPDPYNPIVSLLNSITHPVLKHFRALVPPISGFDISSIFAIIALMFVQYSIQYIFTGIIDSAL
ncbi:Cell division integral membrane protein, YggT and half-length relatives [hydrothermal vent metagenome]|uniref:Cell division integral membrane protein, YggT and half-length relatives n=1 Tax=hydrothermal vent metagenome TaxID=652676 RepID=A0A3B0XIX6_9ZZZZ